MTGRAPNGILPEHKPPRKSGAMTGTQQKGKTMHSKADSALNSIPTPTDRDTWYKILMAYKAAGGNQDTADQWSQRGSNYDPRSFRDTWQSIKPDGGITEASLYGEARKNGWTDPEPGAGGTSQRRTHGAPARNRSTVTQKPQTAQSKANAARILDQISAAAADRMEVLPYWKSRALNDEMADRFTIGYVEHYRQAGTDEPRLIISYPGAKPPYFVARRLSPGGDKDGKKYLYPAKTLAGEKPVFNLPALTGGAENVFVTEGQIDAISLEQMGGAAVGSNEARQITDAISRHGTTAKRFFIIPDSDDTGAKKADKMRDALAAAGLEAYIYPLPAGIQDSNDYLMKDGAGFWDWIKEAPVFADKIKAEALAEYNAISGAAKLDSYIAQWDEGKDTVTPTGFNSLDTILDGGLYPGLYTIGAISSLGKTTFCLQIADSIAASGRDVLYFSLEQSAAELTAKTLSRLTALVSLEQNRDYRNGLTNRSITSKTKRAVWTQTSQRGTMDTAAQRYRDTIGAHMFIVEGMGDISAEQIRNGVKLHIQRRGTAPVIVVDYVQIMDAYGERLTDKQNMDRNIVELKRISRDCNTPVVAISSFNRDSYVTKVDLSAFKESGAIEYTSDCIIGLQPQGMETGDSDKVRAENRKRIKACKESNFREIEAVVLKNRNGGLGTALLEYRTLFNLYTDTGIKPKETQPQTGGDKSGMKF